MKVIPPVHSIDDLQAKAKENPLYKQLTIVVSQSFGGHGATYEQALQHLSNHIIETEDADSVVDAINFSIDLLR